MSRTKSGFSAIFLGTLLAACSSENADNSEGRNFTTQSASSASIVSESKEDDIKEYMHATECSALTNIIKLLVDSDIIHEPGIVDNVDQAAAVWYERSYVAGEKLRRTTQTVELDIDKAEYRLTAPIKALPESEAVALIQKLVRQAKDCA